MATTYIKIFGIEMSGTGFMEFLLRRRFRVRILLDEFGWRHGLPMEPEKYLETRECTDSIKEEMKQVVKNGGIDFVIVIRDPYDWYAPAKQAYRDWNVKRAYQKYRKLYLGYMRILEGGMPFFKNGVVVNFESMRENPGEVIESIAYVLGIDELYPPKSIIPPKDPLPIRIPQAELDIINEILPEEIFDYYGYERSTKQLL